MTDLFSRRWSRRSRRIYIATCCITEVCTDKGGSGASTNQSSDPMAKSTQRRRSSIKKEFNEKELQDLRTAFELIDSNQDGRINPDEFKIMLKNLGIELEDEKIEDLIRSASHAGIEVIDENEFLTWIKHIQELRPESKSEDDGSKELMEAFRVFDLDNNGYITRDELRTAMEKIGESVTEGQLTEFINLADTDKDGRINYEEFARLLS